MPKQKKRRPVDYSTSEMVKLCGMKASSSFENKRDKVFERYEIDPTLFKMDPRVQFLNHPFCFPPFGIHKAFTLYSGFLFLMVTQLKKLLSIRKQPDDKVVPTGVNSFFLLRAMLIAD